MNRREIIFVILTVCLVATFVGFYPTKPRGQVAVPSVKDWSACADDPSQKLSIRWAGPPVYASANPGSWIERNLEDKFNVKFSPWFLDWASYNNRRPLMFSGGDIPDVCWDGDAVPFRRNIKHGFALEIPYEVILKYAPTYVKNLNRYGKAAWLATRFNGRNYGIPTYAASDVYSTPAIWRMDWLRQVGISKTPDTIDELHDTLLKLRDASRAGVIPRNVYGMCPTLAWGVGFVDIFAPHGILPQDFIRRGDQIVWGGVQPECKPILAMLRQWYQEGLIDPDFIVGTAGASAVDEKFANGRTAYVYSYGNWESLDLSNPNSLYSRMKALYPEADLKASAPLVGPDGKRRSRVWGGPAHVIWFGPQVAGRPEIVIRVLTMFEEFAKNQEVFIESRIGQRGVQWEFSPSRGVYALPPFDAPNGEVENLMGIFRLENAYGFYSCCSSPLAFTRALQPADKTAFREQYLNPEWGMSNAIGKSDVVESAGKYLEDLRQFQITSYVAFIRGDKSLDEFDDFVAEWNRRGGRKLTEEANELNRELERLSEILDRGEAVR